MQSEVLDPSEDTFTNDKIGDKMEDDIAKMLDSCQILPQILKNNYLEKDKENSKATDDFFCNSKAQMNLNDKPDFGWNQRKNLLSLIKVEKKYE